jgi:hypothetical protein
MMGDTTHKEQQHVASYGYKSTTEKFNQDVSISDSKSQDVAFSSVDGGKNPRWRSQIKSGRNAGTSLSGIKVRIRIRPSTSGVEKILTLPRTPFPTELRFSEFESRNFVPIPDSATTALLSEVLANNKALENYVKKIRRHQTTVESGVVIGETLRTIRLIKNPVLAFRKGVRSYYNRLKKIGPKTKRLSFRRKREILADTWLEFSFGWKPLITDISSAAQALAESRYMTDRHWQMVTGVGGEEDASLGNLVSLGPNVAAYNARLSETTEVTVKYYGQVDIGSYALSNRRRIGLDWSNFLPTAWELLPYSFLVDYFSNVQEIVSAASLARSSVRWTMKTVIKESVSELVQYELTPPDIADPLRTWYIMYGTPGASKISTTVVERHPYFGTLVPTLRFSLPGSGAKWLNMAALFAGGKALSRYFR